MKTAAHDWPLIYRAVEEGKTSPIYQRYGFALLRKPGVAGEKRDEWRVVRLGAPIGNLAGREHAVCHYLYNPENGGKWVVRDAPLAIPEAERAIVERLRRRENPHKDRRERTSRRGEQPRQ